MFSSIREERPLTDEEHDKTFIERITYNSAGKTMEKGAQKPLETEDVPFLHPKYEVKLHYKAFKDAWEKELLTSDSPSVLAALRSVFESRFWESTTLEFLEILLGFVGPLALKAVIGFTADKSRPVSEGVALVLLLFLSSIIKGISSSWTLQITTSVGMDVHSAVVAAIYRKALKLSPATTYSKGSIVNIQSNDALRMANIVSALNVIWTAPLTIVVAVILLIQNVGVAAFAGLLFMLLLVPINGIAVSQMEMIRMEVIGLTDSRVALMNELLSGVRIAKFMCSEEHFKTKLLDIRKRELELLRSQSYWHAFTSFLVFITPTITSVFTFVTYAALGNVLDARSIFTALSLFNLLRVPLSFLPIVIFSMIESSVALERVQNFLMSAEINSASIERVDPRSDVVISEGVFSWNATTEDGSNPTLGGVTPINMRVKCGSLCLIVGKVGSGKTSLLSCISGQIIKIAGRVVLPSGSVAFCPQQAWLANDTVKGNILFGNAYFKNTYQNCIRSCSLLADLKLFPNGDQTEVGEKGVTLSGGQRQRIALARAVYSNADLVLLDDVLSAVDPHVARSLFEGVLLGELAGKTRIMVTNAIQFLPRADQIIILGSDGDIAFSGTYSEMRQSGLQTDQFASSDDIEGVVPGAAINREREAQQTTDTVEEELMEEESDSSTDDDGPKKSLQEAEERAKGAISWEVILRYMTACGPTLWYFGLFVFLSEIAQTTSDLWLAIWSDRRLSPSPGTNFYLGIYVLLGVVVAVLSFLRGISAVESGIRASRTMHSQMLTSVLRAPPSFFDVTPMGRILTRFSKDMDSLDTALGDGLNSFFTVISMTAGTLIVVLVALPLFLLVLIPLGNFYLTVMNYYRATSRELARISATASSPIYAFFAESLSGTACIQSYGRVERFQDQNDNLVDRYHRCYWFGLTVSRWLSVRLEFCGATIVLAAGLLVATYRDVMDPGQVGLVLTYGLQMVAALEMIVTGVASMETQFNAVERVIHYAKNIPQEAPAVIENSRPPFDWLESRSDVVLRNVSIKYRPDLPNVLHALSIVIPSRAKCGVVGRTGSGKSSFFLAILRMIEIHAGEIQIGGYPIQEMGLRDLRSRIAIVPQEPTLFSGSLRSNLDPYGEYSDREIWENLEKAHCREVAERDAAKLEAVVTENGENYSVGERQLLCLARALLRRCKLLLMDEVTASVDVSTDTLIQQTVNREFTDCTVLTIAHRLETIITGTHVIVLDHGRLAEFGSPKELLQIPGGVFSGMVNSSGPSTADALHRKAGL